MPQEAAERNSPHPLEVALALLWADVPREVEHSPQSWPRWQVLLPHVLAAAAHTGTVGATGTADPDNTAALLNETSTYLWVHARLAEARPLVERALAIDEAAYGPDHPDVAVDLNNLAAALGDLGETDRARLLEERALAIEAERQLGRAGSGG
jgi:hypothetical protein